MRTPIYEFSEEIRPGGPVLWIKRYREGTIDKETQLLKDGGYQTVLACNKRILKIAQVFHADSAKWLLSRFARELDKRIAHWEINNFVCPSGVTDIETFAQAIALDLKK